MRLRLDLLQMKISSLNIARLSGLPPPSLYQTDTPAMFLGDEKNQLTSELQLIENSIQDREREIKMNHQMSEANGAAAEWRQVVP